ncbi:MAG: hypothetical protein WA399_09715, partial [Acidobacteriaceae bacterium]
MARMDFPYGLLPTLLVILGILIAGLCLRRMLALRDRPYPTARRFFERVALSIVALLFLAIGLSSGINAILLHRERASMPGRLVDVNGHPMRIECTGSGSPTLVLDAGLGNDGLIWSAVQPTLSQTTQVCSYDRAGMG